MEKIHGFLDTLQLLQLLLLECKEVNLDLSHLYERLVMQLLSLPSFSWSPTLYRSKHGMQTLWCAWRVGEFSSIKVLIWCQGVMFHWLIASIDSNDNTYSSLSVIGGWHSYLSSRPVWKLGHGIWCVATIGIIASYSIII